MAKQRSVLRRVATRVAIVLGCGFLLLQVLHGVLNLQSVRARVASFVSQQISAQLEGSLQITRIGRIGWSSLSGAAVAVHDDQGEVLSAEGVAATVRLLPLLRSLVGDGPVVVDIESAEISRAVVGLFPTAQQEDAPLRIQRAFSPVPSPEASTDGSGRANQGPSVVLRISAARIENVTVTYPLESGSPVIVQAEALTGKVWLGEALTFVGASPRVHTVLPGVAEPFVGELRASGVVGPYTTRIVLDALRGSIGEAALEARGSYLEPNYFVTAEVQASAEALQSLGLGTDSLPEAHLEIGAVGDWDSVEASVRSFGPQASLVAHADADLEQACAHVRAHVEQLELGAFVSESPDVSLTGDVDVFIDWAPELFIVARAETDPVEVLGRPVPSLSLWGQFDGADALATLSSPECDCLDARATIDLDAAVVEGSLVVRVDGADPNLAPLLDRWGIQVGTLETDAAARFDWERETISGDFRARIRAMRVDQPAIGVHSLDLGGTVRGPVGAPSLDIDLMAQGVNGPSVAIPRLVATAHGTPPTLRISAKAQRVKLGPQLGEADLSASGQITALDPLAVHDVHVQVARDSQKLVARIGSVKVGADIAIDEMVLTGPGTLRINAARSSSGTVDAQVAGSDLDLDRASQLLAPLVPPLSGRVGFVAKLQGTPERDGQWLVSGNSAGFVESLEVPGAKVEAVRWSLTAERSVVSGTARVDLARSGGQVTLSAHDLPVQELASRPIAEWSQARAGKLRVDVDVAADELGALLDLPPPLTLSGRLRASLRVDDEQGRHNRIELSAETRDLTLHSVVEGERVLEREPTAWEFERLNARLLASYDEQSHELQAWVRMSDRNRDRLIGEANLRVSVPQGFPSAAASQWDEFPVELDVRFPSAPLDEIPGRTLPRGTRGTLEGGAFLRGTLADPRVDAVFDVKDFSVKSAEESFPVGFRFDGHYADNRAKVSLQVEHEGRRVITAELTSANVDGLIAGTRTAAYDAQVEVDELPLGCFPYVRDYAVEGSVSMSAAVEGTSDGPDGSVKLRAGELTALDVAFSGLELDAAVNPGGGYQASAHLSQPTGEGRVKIQGKLSLAQSDEHPLGLEAARFSARNLEIAPLRFAFREVLSDLSGKLTGDLAVNLSPKGLRSRGDLKLKDGRVQIVTLGQELHDINARIRALPGGDLHIDDISARAREGRLRGNLQLGYDFGGITRLEARAVIPDDARYPVVYQGLPLGEVSGTVDLHGERVEDGLAMSLKTSKLDFYVDEQLDTELQSLSPSELVEVGTTTPNGKFVAYARDRGDEQAAKPGPPFEVHLGNDVWVHRGLGAFIAVTGDLAVESSGQIGGRLSLPEGQIDVLGRIFEVDRGEVTFREDEPANPVVLVEATWESPSGHRITAEYRGPVDDGTLTLSSDPPLTQDQVLNVILFDDPEGGFGTDGEGSGAGAASALATTVTTSGLTRALSDLSNLEISAGVDTSEQDNARPEIGVRLSPRWSIGVQYNPEGGSDALSRNPDRALLSVRARITKRWSVESTVGDGGTSILDLMWRYHH